MADIVYASPDGLEQFYRRVLASHDVSEPAVDAVAAHLLAADLMGVDSHGLQQIIGYRRSLASGRIDPAAHPEIERDAGGILKVNGQMAFGHYVGEYAINLAMARASKNGIAAVFAANSNHYGMGGYYTRLAAEAGCIAYSCSDTNVVDLAPFGMTEALLGNNPTSWALPAPRGAPIVLDHACGICSGGKVARKGYLRDGFPNDIGFDRDGNPTGDPASFMHSMARSSRDSGLALIADMLCGPLLGTAAAVFKQKPANDYQNGTGHFFMVIDPRGLADLERFNDEVIRALDEYRSHQDEASPFYYPGELETSEKARRLEQGVPVPVDLLAKLETAFGEDATGLLTPDAI